MASVFHANRQGGFAFPHPKRKAFSCKRKLSISFFPMPFGFVHIRILICESESGVLYIPYSFLSPFNVFNNAGDQKINQAKQDNEKDCIHCIIPFLNL